MHLKGNDRALQKNWEAGPESLGAESELAGVEIVGKREWQPGRKGSGLCWLSESREMAKCSTLEEPQREGVLFRGPNLTWPQEPGSWCEWAAWAAGRGERVVQTGANWGDHAPLKGTTPPQLQWLTQGRTKCSLIFSLSKGNPHLCWGVCTWNC